MMTMTVVNYDVCESLSPERQGLKRKSEALDLSPGPRNKNCVPAPVEDANHPFRRLSVFESKVAAEGKTHLQRTSLTFAGRMVGALQVPCFRGPCSASVSSSLSPGLAIPHFGASAPRCASDITSLGPSPSRPDFGPSSIHAKVPGEPDAKIAKFNVKEYRKTAGTYSDQDDWLAAAQEEYGENAEVAEWNDIKAAIDESSDDAKALAERLGAWNQGLSFILNNGEKCSGDRYFFVAPHYGEVPTWFCFNDNMGQGGLSLGTWKKVKRPILVRVRRAGN